MPSSEEVLLGKLYQEINDLKKQLKQEKVKRFTALLDIYMDQYQDLIDKYGIDHPEVMEMKNYLQTVYDRLNPPEEKPWYTGA